jgi:hypothetical protein
MRLENCASNKIYEKKNQFYDYCLVLKKEQAIHCYNIGM